MTPSCLAVAQHNCWPQQAGLWAERRHLRDICHISYRPLCNTPIFLLSLSCFVPIYEGQKQVPGLTQPLAITCPWVLFKPLNVPEQIAPAERLLLVCSFLWPPLIIMPISMAERQCRWCQCVFHGFHCFLLFFTSTISFYISCKTRLSWRYTVL